MSILCKTCKFVWLLKLNAKFQRKMAVIGSGLDLFPGLKMGIMMMIMMMTHLSLLMKSLTLPKCYHLICQGMKT